MYNQLENIKMEKVTSRLKISVAQRFGVTCSCCGKGVQHPQFIGNKAYGVSCFRKLSDKPFNMSGLWLPASKPVEIHVLEESKTVYVVANINGASFTVFSRVMTDQYKATGRIANTGCTDIRGGLVNITSTPLKTDSDLWKDTQINRRLEDDAVTSIVKNSIIIWELEEGE